LRETWVYVGRRTVFAVVVFFVIITISFLIATSSGNHYYVALGFLEWKVSPIQLEVLARYYQLNVPIYDRFFMWLSDLARGDFGISTGGSVISSFIWNKTLMTLELVVPATVVSVLGGLYVGMYSARHVGSKIDATVTVLSVIAVALPIFWVGLLAIEVIAGDLHLLPAFGATGILGTYWWGDPVLDRIAHLILPVSMLSLGSVGVYARLARGAALDVLQEDYVNTYRSLGVPDSKINRHAVRGTLSAVVPFVGASVGTLLSSSPAVEYVFSWPGIGLQFVQSAKVYDQPVVMACVIIVTAITLVANLAADLVLTYIDPRVKLA
jgi:peptide/nickel transport system permease protein